MSTLPSHPPPGLPHDAVFEREAGGWVVGGFDEEGRRHGEYTVFREDGTVMLRGHYAADVRVGTFRGYHPSGELASEGSYADGVLDGVYVKYASESPDAEPLRGCCVPPGAQRMHLHYRQGRFVKEDFLDGEGYALRSDGSRLPPCPAAVPELAEYDDGSARWIAREPLDRGTVLWSYYDGEGRRTEEAEYLSGQRVQQRLYDPSGVLLESSGFDAQGLRHGPFYRMHPSPSPFADARLRGERGTLEHGRPVGVWEFLDAAGLVLHGVDRGVLPSEARLEDLAKEELSGNLFEGAQYAVDLARRGRIREALWIAGRILARDRSDKTLQELLAQAVVPLAVVHQEAWQRMYERKRSVALGDPLDGLLAGADPAEMLRALAMSLPEDAPAARDFIEAALALHPEDPRAHASRAHLRLAWGDVQGALDDAAFLAARGDEQAASHLQTVARITFPAWRFETEAHPIAPPNADLAEIGIEQSLPAIHHVLAIYATRILRVREKLIACMRGETPAWLPPVPVGLLPHGAVELRRFTATITDESEDGTETSEVEIDETIDLDTSSIREAMTTARADWDAACWLCWATGANRLELPPRVDARPEFPAMVHDTMVRAWRAHDQYRTLGLVSKNRGVPGFSWEGLAVESLTRPLAEKARRQYLERRAMFFWLLFPQNISPFQSDLRQIQ